MVGGLKHQLQDATVVAQHGAIIHDIEADDEGIEVDFYIINNWCTGCSGTLDPPSLRQIWKIMKKNGCII